MHVLAGHFAVALEVRRMLLAAFGTSIRMHVAIRGPARAAMSSKPSRSLRPSPTSDRHRTARRSPCRCQPAWPSSTKGDRCFQQSGTAPELRAGRAPGSWAACRRCRRWCLRGRHRSSKTSACRHSSKGSPAAVVPRAGGVRQLLAQVPDEHEAHGALLHIDSRKLAA